MLFLIVYTEHADLGVNEVQAVLQLAHVNLDDPSPATRGDTIATSIACYMLTPGRLTFTEPLSPEALAEAQRNGAIAVSTAQQRAYALVRGTETDHREEGATASRERLRELLHEITPELEINV